VKKVFPCQVSRICVFCNYFLTWHKTYRKKKENNSKKKLVPIAFVRKMEPPRENGKSVNQNKRHIMQSKELSIGDKVETPISKIRGEIVQLGFQEGRDYYDVAFENGIRGWMLDCEIREIQIRSN
jgi:hypothetical protein